MLFVINFVQFCFIDTYDIVTVVGSHIANHIESEALIEIIRLVKRGNKIALPDKRSNIIIPKKHLYIVLFIFPGGIVCIVARMESLSNLDKYKDSFFPLCNDLENAGKWQKIECCPCPYWGKIQGYQLLYRVCWPLIFFMLSSLFFLLICHHPCEHCFIYI